MRVCGKLLRYNKGFGRGRVGEMLKYNNLGLEKQV